MPSTYYRTPLTTGWRWRLANSNGQTEADENPKLREWNVVDKSVPSVIHSELLANKDIEDYRVGENERSVQWVGLADWEYSCSFHGPDTKAEEINLVFEGLDTIATVKLNGTEILQSENQFLSHRVSIKHLLKAEGQNELSIVFQSAVKKSRELEGKHGKRTSIIRDAGRNYIRKSAYHWGWDWGPVILTAGPWKPVFLETCDNRIADVHITSDLATDHGSALVTINIRVEYQLLSHSFTIKITDQDGQVVAKEHLSSIGQNATVSVRLLDPKLWWPNGQGDQHLYTLRGSLLDTSSGEIFDSKVLRFGIRTIKVIQRPLTDAPGKTFMFNVNGRDIFAQGANWIPADNLLTTVSRSRYFDWMKLARYHHLNMIRVWGGGIYEAEDFFDACDELGLLVWHDFAFACGDYPTNPEFLAIVKKEAETQVLRLRNRTSLALLCGNNEDFMFCDMGNVKYDFQDTTGPFLDKDTFPQREIYLRTLPSVCHALCPDIQYWPSSPWGGGDANDPTVGDIHQWTVWHVDQKPYQAYKGISGRFVSEFGMHGFPVQRTVNENYFTPSTPNHLRHPQSSVVDCRNKGHGSETRLARYLAENFRYDANNLSNWIYSTQLLQSEAYGYAYRDWKRKFAGKGKEECAGALVWQFNDVYPTTSWAFVDYYLRPKPAACTIRRACADLSVGSSRTPSSRWFNEDRPDEPRIPSFEIFAHNMTAKDIRCMLVIKAYDFAMRKWTLLSPDEKERGVTLQAGYSTELVSIGPHASWSDDSLIVLQSSLVDLATNKVLARYVDWPEPYRYLYWPKDTKVGTSVQQNVRPGVSVASSPQDWESFVTVWSNQPIKGCWLEPVYDGKEAVDGPEPLWEDNMFDIMPDEEMVVGVNGLRDRGVKVRFLYDWELK